MSIGVQGPRGMVGLIGPTGPSFNINKPILSAGNRYVSDVGSDINGIVGRPELPFETMGSNPNHIYTGTVQFNNNADIVNSIASSKITGPFLINSDIEIRDVELILDGTSSIDIQVGSTAKILNCTIKVDNAPSNYNLFNVTANSTLILRDCNIIYTSNVDDINFINADSGSRIEVHNTKSTNDVTGQFTAFTLNDANVITSGCMYNLNGNFILINSTSINGSVLDTTSNLDISGSVTILTGTVPTMLDITSFSAVPKNFALNITSFTLGFIQDDTHNFRHSNLITPIVPKNNYNNVGTLNTTVPHSTVRVGGVNVNSSDSLILLDSNAITLPEIEAKHGRKYEFICRALTSTITFETYPVVNQDTTTSLTLALSQGQWAILQFSNITKQFYILSLI